MKKAAVVLSAAAVIAMTTVSIATRVETRGGWGWGAGIAGGLIAGADGLASSAYGYGPGCGYYGPGYCYYGGDAPIYYGGYIPTTVDTDTIVLGTGVGNTPKVIPDRASRTSRLATGSSRRCEADRFQEWLCGGYVDHEGPLPHPAQDQAQ